MVTTTNDLLLEAIANLERRLTEVPEGSEAWHDVHTALELRKARLERTQVAAIPSISPAGRAMRAWFQETLYCVTLPGVRGQDYVQAATAYKAIAHARTNAGLPGLTGGTARKAVQGEWDCNNFYATGEHFAH